MHLASRILPFVLVLAIFAATAECGCMSVSSPDPSPVTQSDVPMACCQDPSGHACHHQSSQPKPPCKSECHHCGQMVLNAQNSSVNSLHAVAPFDLPGRADLQIVAVSTRLALHRFEA